MVDADGAGREDNVALVRAFVPACDAVLATVELKKALALLRGSVERNLEADPLPDDLAAASIETGDPAVDPGFALRNISPK